MDNKITTKRLKQLLSYDLVKIIAIIVAGVLVWSLLFTMLGDSLDEGQTLSIYSYNVTIHDEEINSLLTGDLSDYRSYDVVETNYYSFGKYTPNNTTVSQQFAAWSSVGQLDAIFISSAKDLKSTSKDEEGNDVDTFYSLAVTYVDYYYNLEDLANNAILYCKNKGGYNDAGEMDASVAKNYFNVRKKGDNFLRHGLINAEQEVDRFEKIWENAHKLKYLLDDDTLDIWYVEKDSEGKEYKLGVEMGKLYKQGASTVTGKNTASLCSYSAEPEEGGSVADGASLCIFNNAMHQPDLVYESLAFLVAVIENYSACLESYAG